MPLLAQNNLHKAVNPFIGTGGHGHTFPGATMPFGMVQLSPDTRLEGWDACGGYHYSDSTIIGFSHLHLSGTGVPDYGDILVMPTVGELRPQRGDERRPGSGYRSRFSHADEEAAAGYYRVELKDYGITAELTATRRVGFHRYTFPRAEQARIIIDLEHGLGPDKVIEASIQVTGDREIVGTRRSNGWAKDQRVFFAARFSKPFKSHLLWGADTLPQTARSMNGVRMIALGFGATAREQILVKVGISAVSVEGARKNLDKEVPGWDFDKVRNDAASAWDRELGKIEIEGASAAQRTTFYTALYHAMIAPNLFSDVDGRYRGMDDRIRSAKGFDMYTVFSLWDTFRAEHPLLSIIDRKRTVDFIRSLLSKYDESTHLPVWELAANETWCMIGYHAVPVIVDAYCKGIRDYDARKSLEAMKHSAQLNQYGLEAYRAAGFIAGDRESESVSKTLEYAYDDWCIAQMARAMGMKEDEELYGQRAQYWKNLFDPVTGFHRPKMNGCWVEPFDPAAVTMHFTEANAWQYNFFVPHDVNGLITAFGGKERFVRKLDSLFAGGTGLSGRNQADITGLIGQYAQGNEPSHHVAYLYNYAGQPWKGQRIVRRIMDSLFTDKPDGLCGNDDCGQMSAWYVMSAIGLYQVCPGLPEYAVGSPLFPKAVVHLENGKSVVVQADEQSRDACYISSIRLNGNPMSRSFVSHGELEQGAGISMRMSAEPNREFASSAADCPASLPVDPIVPVPAMRAAGKIFIDSVVVTLSSLDPAAKINHVLGSLPLPAAGQAPSPVDPYDQPIVIRNSASVTAIGIRADKRSFLVSAEFIKRIRVGTLKLSAAYSPQYTGGGDDALVDGERGAADFRLGAWQGYEGGDLTAVLDLGSVKSIGRTALGCLQDINSWIFFPEYVEISFSENGAVYNKAYILQNEISPREEGALLKEFGTGAIDLRARYIKVHAKNIGRCPEWHKAAGSKSWLFADELVVETK